MPLVTVNASATVRTEGVQPFLVFSDEGHAMGLVVDQIVDIVEDTLHIEVASETPGVLGSAVIKGQPWKWSMSGHYLPLAFEDWLRRKDMNVAVKARTLLFVDDSAFFRNMLTPVLKAGRLQRHGGVACRGCAGMPARRPPDRRGRHRHRDAGHERLRARRGGRKDPRTGRGADRRDALLGAAIRPGRSNFANIRGNRPRGRAPPPPRSERRQRDDRTARCADPCGPLGELVAVHARHLDVGDDHVDLAAVAQAFQRILGTRHRHDVVAGRLEHREVSIVRKKAESSTNSSVRALTATFMSLRRSHPRRERR